MSSSSVSDNDGGVRSRSRSRAKSLLSESSDYVEDYIDISGVTDSEYIDCVDMKNEGKQVDCLKRSGTLKKRIFLPLLWTISKIRRKSTKRKRRLSSIEVLQTPKSAYEIP